MTYLVDANVLSEPTRPSPNQGVVGWLRDNEPNIVVNPIVVGELKYGILLLPFGRKRDRLEDWFDAGIGRLDCVDWDFETGLCWAGLIARLRADGVAMPIKDSMIAASGLAHDLVVVTRDIRDFRHSGVQTHNPWP